MRKVDYKRDYRELYLPGREPVIVNVPAMSFISISGQGDPNTEQFSQAVEALYALSYAVKMSHRSKSGGTPEGYYDYTVFPLEGVWDLADKDQPLGNKDNYLYTLMIRQPEFLDCDLFEHFRQSVMAKKQNPFLAQALYNTYQEGLCCQMLHVGSYDDEPASFSQMQDYCDSQGYDRSCRRHREIYLSDPRRTAAEKLRTVLRFKVSKRERLR